MDSTWSPGPKPASCVRALAPGITSLTVSGYLEHALGPPGEEVRGGSGVRSAGLGPGAWLLFPLCVWDQPHLVLWASGCSQDALASGSQCSSLEDSAWLRSSQGWLARPFSEASAGKRCCPASIPREPCTLASPRVPSFSGGDCPQAFPTPGPKSLSIKGPSAGAHGPGPTLFLPGPYLPAGPELLPRGPWLGGPELLGSRGPPGTCAPRPRRPGQSCL